MLRKNKLIAEHSFVYPAKTTYVSDVKKKIIDICRENDFSYKDMNNILIVIDEVCANIIKHAYRDSEGDMAFEIQIKTKGFYITIIDQGRTFNWKSFRTPNLNKYVNIGKKGGLGLWIIRKLTDYNDYKVTDRGNELHLVRFHTKPNILKRVLDVLTSTRGIKEKFALATTFFILFLVAGVYLYFIYHEQASLKSKFLGYNVDLVKSLARSSKDRILKNNYLPVIKLVKEIKSNNENIDEIFLVNSENVIVAHNMAGRLYKRYSPRGEITGSETINRVQVVSFSGEEGRWIEMIEPVEFQGRELGEVHLKISRESMDEVASGKRMNLLVAGFLVFAVAAMGIYLLLGLIVKPIKRLREGVVAIGEGRLDHRIELDGEDEFSEIANAFNDMAKKFKGAQNSLIEQEKMQKEIQVAKEIQHTLLPKDIPDTGGFDIASLYRSAKEVGGDYYDVIKVGANQIGVMVADVSGKGVPGSLVMTITRTVARLVALRNKSAKNTLVKVNDFVKEDMKKGMFVTAFYLVLDSISRKINFASAGHDPLLLYRAKEDKVYWVKPKGFPLGISLPDEELFRKVMVEETVKLKKDDMILVYTDGITEAMNGKREQWGEKRFVEAVRKYGKMTAAAFIENLDRDIKEFTQGYPQNDDITIVAIKEKKTDAGVLRKVEKDIEKLKAKGMKARDIEKELGVDIKTIKKMREEKKAGKKTEMRFLTFEEKKHLMDIVIAHPDWSAAKYSAEMRKKHGKKVTENLIENELKRINLTTIKKRKRYADERI